MYDPLYSFVEKLPGEDDIPVELAEAPLTCIGFVTMSTIVDFLHNDQLKVNGQNLKDLLLAADLLVMRSVEVQCFNFIKVG